MKKRLTFLGLILFTTCSLSACQFFMPFIDGGSNQYTYPSSYSKDSELSPAQSSSSEDDESSISSGDQSSSDSSSEDVPGGPKKASYTYMDYVQNNAMDISSAPCVGSAHLLVIPVWFTDSTNYITSVNKENVRNDIQKAYFGSDEEVGWKSVKSYYEYESHGALTITGKVSNWYECGSSSSKYRTDDGEVTKTCTLVQNATNWYFTNNPSDSRTNYDKDKDGYLDSVMIIYACPDSTALNNDSYENLWAYCFWVGNTSLKNKTNPGVNVFFWASYDFLYGYTNANTRTGKNYYSGDTKYCTLDTHTFIHEMGHVFGLTDYYDYSNHGYKPAGTFSMQDYNVGGHDPYSSYALGWGKAYIPTESTTINLKPFSETGEMILLTPNFNEYNSPFDEYLILEYYTPTGLNAFDTAHPYTNNNNLKGSSERGIRLWHVDGRLLYTTNGSVYASQITTNPRHNARVLEMMSNTYYDGTSYSSDYISPLGTSYANYNLLQLIRNNTSTDYKPTDYFKTDALFREGAEFTMSKYSSQFVKSGKLNTNINLGFSFKVGTIYSDRITITITKN